jgi:hypothetical protein
MRVASIGLNRRLPLLVALISLLSLLAANYCLKCRLVRQSDENVEVVEQ